MAWKEISGTTHTFTSDANTYTKNNIETYIEYDADRTNVTSTYIRFRARPVNENVDGVAYWDSVFVLYNANNYPENIGRTVRIIKKHKNYEGSCDIAEDSEGIKLTKGALDKQFEIEDYFICNNGQDAGGYYAEDLIADPDNAYGYMTNGVHKNQAKGGRANWTQQIPSGFYDISASTTVAKPGSNPTLTVSDLGNNQVLFSGTLGSDAGTNGNEIESATIYYTTDNTDPSSSSTRKSITLTAASGASYSEDISITKACTVRAYIECEFKYNTTDASSSVAAKYFIKPKNPGKPYLTDNSFKNDRLIVRQNWGWQWDPANAGNTEDYNEVIGYRIRCFVKRKGADDFVNTKIIDYYDKETVRSYELTSGDWVYDRTSGSYPMPMAAGDFEEALVPGDQIKLSVQAYSVNGVTPTPNKLLSSRVESAPETIQNAGVVHIKAGNEWVEGQVWVKAEGEWQEAETVNVKTSEGWQESQ